MSRRARARAVTAPDGMNKTERRYLLEVILPAMERGAIIDWRREPIRLRIAGRSGAEKSRAPWYTPDFVVLHPDGTLEMIEVKGWTGTAAAAAMGGSGQDARLRIRIAAALYPWFCFVLVAPRRQKDGGGWSREEFSQQVDS